MSPFWQDAMISKGLNWFCNTSLHPICTARGSASHITAFSGADSSGFLASWSGLLCCESTAHTDSSGQRLMLTFLRILYTFKCFRIEFSTVLSHSKKTPCPPSASFKLEGNTASLCRLYIATIINYMPTGLDEDLKIVTVMRLPLKKKISFYANWTLGLPHFLQHLSPFTSCGFASISIYNYLKVPPF